MARPPKPEHLKLLHGTARKDRVRNVPSPARGRMLAPSHLSEEAKKEWSRVEHLLRESGVLSKLDRAALASYCQAWALWVRAEEELAQDGEELIGTLDHGAPYANPLIGIARKAHADMLRWARELGLTPASRSRIHVEPPKKQETNPFKAIG